MELNNFNDYFQARLPFATWLKVSDMGERFNGDKGSGFNVLSSRFRVQGSEFGVWS
jgi:hypothetical protein